MSLYNIQSKKVKKGIALGKLCLMNNKRILSGILLCYLMTELLLLQHNKSTRNNL